MRFAIFFALAFFAEYFLAGARFAELRLADAFFATLRHLARPPTVCPPPTPKAGLVGLPDEMCCQQ